MTLFVMVTTASSRSYTERALDSFFSFTPLKAHDHVLLIDNDCGWKNSSLQFPSSLSIIENESPRGFAANMNRGIAIALERHCDIVLLNNDLFFSEGWSERLFERSDAIVSPISSQEWSYKTEHLTLKTPLTLSDIEGKEDLVATLCGFHKTSNTGFLDVLILPFFAARIPIAALESVGYLDEGYGAGGGEDYDYCLRAHLDGFSVQYDVSSYIIHFGGKSSWAGVETQSQRTEREHTFFTHFEKTWGPQITDLVLRNQHAVVENSEELSACALGGNYRKIILALRSHP